MQEAEGRKAVKSSSNWQFDFTVVSITDEKTAQETGQLLTQDARNAKQSTQLIMLRKTKHVGRPGGKAKQSCYRVRHISFVRRQTSKSSSPVHVCLLSIPTYSVLYVHSIESVETRVLLLLCVNSEAPRAFIYAVLMIRSCVNYAHMLFNICEIYEAGFIITDIKK